MPANALSLALEEIRCPKHGATMTQRDTKHQTPEQLFCGAWWDCTTGGERCSNSILFPSAELRQQWREMSSTPHAAILAAGDDPK